MRECKTLNIISQKIAFYINIPVFMILNIQLRCQRLNLENSNFTSDQFQGEWILHVASEKLSVTWLIFIRPLNNSVVSIHPGMVR